MIRCGAWVSFLNPAYRYYTFAFYVSNDASVNKNVSGQPWYDINNLKSIDWLENETGYDLFSNIPDLTEVVIESRPANLIREWLDTTLSSPLLAASSDSTVIITDTSIRHSSTAENTSILEPVLDIHSTGFPQSGPGQIDVLHHCLLQFSSGQISISQIGISENRLREISSHEQNTSKDGIGQIRFSDHSSNKQGVSQVSSNQGTVNNGAAEIGIRENSPIQTIASKSDSGEISLTITVTPEHISDSHVSEFHVGLPSSNLIALNSTAVSLWQSFHPNFDLTLQVTDLPSGQLAEAQLTSFASNGTPNAGTLLLDFNGNDLGWFIDSTPWENSEFTPFDCSQGTEPTAFRATSSSPASGHYDLLTTILHELGHLAGLIQGNPAYDSRVKLVNGTPTFIGNGFSATLTVDRSHLDPRLHPYNLTNTTRKSQGK